MSAEFSQNPSEVYIPRSLSPIIGSKTNPGGAISSWVSDSAQPSLSVGDSAVDLSLPPEIRKPCAVPRLPRGRRLTLTMWNNYGDPKFIGMTSLVLFDQHGRRMVFPSPSSAVLDVKCAPSPDTADIDVTKSIMMSLRPQESPGSDGASAAAGWWAARNIIDGVDATRIPSHQWLCCRTETSGGPPSVTIDLEAATFASPDAPAAPYAGGATLSALRIVNFNHNRVNVVCGVRRVSIALDGKMIFCGDVTIASGDPATVYAKSEVVLFTTEAAVLGRIEAYEASYKGSEGGGLPSGAGSRPSSRRNSGAAVRSRPTSSATPNNAITGSLLRSSVANLRDSLALSSEIIPPRGSVVLIQLLSTWGDRDFVGLTGISLLDDHDEPLALQPDDIELLYSPTVAAASTYAQPKTMAEGHGGPGVLLDGVVKTTNESHMWCVALTAPLPALRITLPSSTAITSLALWNYNSPGFMCRGVRRLMVYVDDRPVLPEGGVILRRGLGIPTASSQAILLSANPTSLPDKLSASHASDSFAALLRKSLSFPTMPQRTLSRFAALTGAPLGPLSEQHSDIQPAPPSGDTPARTTYITPMYPTALTYRFELTGTWGDPHYIGLNNISFYDEDGVYIPIHPSYVEAKPRDVSIMKSCANDVRVLPNLVDGVGRTFKESHMWLTPWTPDGVVTIWINFHCPTSVSVIRVWNYAKTPARGAKEATIYADNTLVWQGEFALAPRENELVGWAAAHAGKESRLPDGSNPYDDFGQSIVFTLDPAIVERETYREECRIPSAVSGVLLTNIDAVRAKELTYCSLSVYVLFLSCVTTLPRAAGDRRLQRSVRKYDRVFAVYSCRALHSDTTTC